MVLSWNFVSQWRLPNGSNLVYLRALVGLNWSGVDLFFVLSGFLIGGILIDNRGATNYFRTFYVRRACRIFPLYYLCLFSFLLAARSFKWCESSLGYGWLFENQGVAGIGIGQPNSIPMWTYLVHLQNFWMAQTNSWGPGYLGITWSLAVEEQFYLLLPVVVYLCKPKQVGSVAFLCIIAAPITRLASSGLESYCMLSCRIDALMVGVLVAWLLRLESVLTTLRKSRSFVVGGLFVCLCFFALLGRHPGILGKFNHSFLALFYGLVVLAVVTFPSLLLTRFLRTGWLQAIGRISYGIYLLHMAFVGIAFMLVFERPPEIRTAFEAIISLTAVLAAIIVSYFSYQLFETKIMGIGSFYRYETKK